MEQNPTWDTNSRSAGQEFPSRAIVYYHIQNPAAYPHTKPAKISPYVKTDKHLQICFRFSFEVYRFRNCALINLNTSDIKVFNIRTPLWSNIKWYKKIGVYIAKIWMYHYTRKYYIMS